jgi:anaerobic magnesium-protoporphyrin IX monomethyl ester cyclase
VRNIKFVDEMFVLNRSHVLGICDRIIERGYDLNIWAYARVDTVKDEFLDRLRRAGFRWLALGIESGSKHVRDGVEKGRFGSTDIIKVVRKIQDAGINVIGNYIFGLPDDTYETMQQTLDLAIEANCEFANIYCAMAYPGSKLYRMAVEQGWELPSSWIGYSQHSFETFPVRTESLTSAEVLRFRDEAFRQYFTNPRYLDLVRRRFGEDVLAHVRQMTKITLRRKLLSEPVTA